MAAAIFGWTYCQPPDRWAPGSFAGRERDSRADTRRKTLFERCAAKARLLDNAGAGLLRFGVWGED
jgi:hypothetical protein